MLTSLSAHCGPNAGSLRTIEYAPIEWIDAAAFEKIINDNHVWIPSVPFTEGNDWLTAYVLPRKRIFTEQQRDTTNGSIWTKSVEGVMPHHTPAVAGMLEAMTRHRYLVRITDRNGYTFIIGDLEYPLIFSSSSTTGEDVTELNHNTLRWEGVAPWRAYGVPA